MELRITRFRPEVTQLLTVTFSNADGRELAKATARVPLLVPGQGQQFRVAVPVPPVYAHAAGVHAISTAR